MLNHLSEGLSLILSNPNSDAPLPAEWESQMCELLQDPATQAAVSAIALPLEECVAHLHSCIAAVIDSSRPAAAVAAMGVAAGNLHSTGVSGALGELDIDAGDAPAAAAAAARGDGVTSVRYIAVAVEIEGTVRQQIQALLADAFTQQQQQQQPLGTDDQPREQQQQQPAVKVSKHKVCFAVLLLSTRNLVRYLHPDAIDQLHRDHCR